MLEAQASPVQTCARATPRWSSVGSQTDGLRQCRRAREERSELGPDQPARGASRAWNMEKKEREKEPKL